jgi:hypothetical protein
MLRPFAFLCAFSMLSLLPLHAASVQIRKAVFSDQQLFWPELAGKGKPPAGKPSAPTPARANKVSPKALGTPFVRLGVLPIRIRDYSESLPCDSCHRLSANGMEFFLENYLKDRMEARFPGNKVELIAPNLPLVEKKLDLLAYLDSLQLPWDKWLADSGQEVVYRPRDRFTRAADRKRLDKLGGLLGMTHLLLPSRVQVHVTPKSSVTHSGGLAWTFSLVLWNVAEGSPEWALQYTEDDPSMDLDESLEGRLDTHLAPAWNGLPAELTALWGAEPR